MPHRTALVVADDFDEALSPFQHNGSGDCPREYLVFIDFEDALLDEYLNGGEDKWVTLANGDRLHGRHPSFLSNGAFRYPSDATVSFNLPHKARYPSFEDFVREYEGLEARDAENGRYGRWENPNGKWNWYLLGGRWRGFFALKEGAHGVLGQNAPKSVPQVDAGDARADSCKAGDIDFEGVARKSGCRIASDATEETFVHCTVDGVYSTHAVLMNGSWYELGGTVWWGKGLVPTTEEHWKRAVHELLQELPPQATVSLVDYHG
jgi:hypothetical protein